MRIGVKIDGTSYMEALELLGSRYIKPEQVAVGPVETLRAQNAATWRVVFIHRVSTTQEAAEQANLLKLLTTALVRSSEAKRLVLDFGEEQGFWNVVTESEPQCESLRDWLQAEVDGAAKGEAILSAEQAAAMGEFARLFSRGAKLPPRKAVTAKAPRATIAPVAPPPAAQALEQHAPEPVAELVPEPLPVPAPVPPEPEAAAPPPAVEPQPHVPAAEIEVPEQPQDEQPIVVPDDIPVIVISAPPPDRAMAAAQSSGESAAYFDDAPPPPPLSESPMITEDPLIPEIVSELPKAVAEAPKVVPIDGKPHEPKTDSPKPAEQNDAPLFANSMPKPARLSKMAVFFIILGVVALLLILLIVYLSNKT